MNTDKALKKLHSFVFYHGGNKLVTNDFVEEFNQAFAKYLYPVQFKINKNKAASKTALTMKSLLKLDYADIASSIKFEIIADLICITKDGLKRLEEVRDRSLQTKQKIIFSVLGAIGTAILGLAIFLITNHFTPPSTL